MKRLRRLFRRGPDRVLVALFRGDAQAAIAHYEKRHRTRIAIEPLAKRLTVNLGGTGWDGWTAHSPRIWKWGYQLRLGRLCIAIGIRQEREAGSA